MSSSQRKVILFGIVVVVAMFLIPPWTESIDYEQAGTRINLSRSLGYAPLAVSFGRFRPLRHRLPVLGWFMRWSEECDSVWRRYRENAPLRGKGYVSYYDINPEQYNHERQTLEALAAERTGGNSTRWRPGPTVFATYSDYSTVRIDYAPLLVQCGVLIVAMVGVVLVTRKEDVGGRGGLGGGFRWNVVAPLGFGISAVLASSFEELGLLIAALAISTGVWALVGMRAPNNDKPLERKKVNAGIIMGVATAIWILFWWGTTVSQLARVQLPPT